MQLASFCLADGQVEIDITRASHAGHYAKGLTNLNSTVIAVIDLRS